MIIDDNIRQHVLAELHWLPMADAGNLQVTVSRGTVTLSGHVATFGEKLAVEKAVKRMKGVRSLIADVTVQPVLPAGVSDAAIAAAAIHTLSWHTELPARRIQVAVKDGYVTMDGDVDWQYQKDHAYDAVKHIAGVKGISNFIFVKPKANAALVKDDILHALARKADFRPIHISVQAEGNKVILQGKVRTWAERQMADYAAWSCPGVANVKNELEVAG